MKHLTTLLNLLAVWTETISNGYISFNRGSNVTSHLELSPVQREAAIMEVARDVLNKRWEDSVNLTAIENNSTDFNAEDFDLKVLCREVANADISMQDYKQGWLNVEKEISRKLKLKLAYDRKAMIEKGNKASNNKYRTGIEDTIIVPPKSFLEHEWEVPTKVFKEQHVQIVDGIPVLNCGDFPMPFVIST